MSMNWTTPLIAAGVDVVPEAEGAITVRVGKHKARYVMHRSTRSPRPSQVRVATEPSLLQIPHVSTQAARLLEAAGWSFATNDGEALLQFSDGFSWRSPETGGAALNADSTNNAKRWSRGMSTIVHALLLHDGDESLTQSSLAATSGVTQAHVSRVVRRLREADLVSAVRGRPQIIDRDTLIDQWLARRRFDPVVTYWSTDRDLAEFLDQILQHVPGCLVSGDVAADALAPHRRPNQLLVLSDHGSLLGTDAIAVLTPEEASVIFIVTDDPVVLGSGRTSTWRRRTMRVADPYQVLWDLGHAIGADAQQAATVWRNAARRWPR